MDDTTRLIIYLKDEEGLSYTQIANRLNMTWDAVRSRYRRNCTKTDDDDIKQDSGCIVIGSTPDYSTIDVRELWQRHIKAQKAVEQHLRLKREEQKIILVPPCAQAILSDLHLDDPMTDYKSIYDDVRLIRDTPDFYAGFIGDGLNNWIASKYLHLLANQKMSSDEGWELFYSWLNMLKGSLDFVVSGNHENWCIRAAGIDRVKDALKGTMVLYDQHQVLFDLVVGQKTYRIKARHKWPYGSVFNTTHSIEVGWERGGDDFVIGLGGHVHKGTFYREFERHHIKRYAVLVGTYKLEDSLGQEIGLSDSYTKGCGAFVFDVDGSMIWTESLKKAADYLEYLKKKR